MMGNYENGRNAPTCPKCGSEKALLMLKNGSQCPDCKALFEEKKKGD